VYAWATAGIGASTEGFAGVAGFDLEVQRNLVSIRTAGVGKLFEDSFQDFGLLYGRTHRGARGMISASAGVGLMNGDRCTGLFGTCTRVTPRISLPLAVRADWHGLPFLGLSLYLFADFNGARNFGGAAVGLEAGRLR
jgi:hypothetical protein